MRQEPLPNGSDSTAILPHASTRISVSACAGCDGAGRAPLRCRRRRRRYAQKSSGVVAPHVGARANRAARLLRGVEPDRQAAELHDLAPEAARDDQAEGLSVKGDAPIEIRDVDVDQHIHARQRNTSSPARTRKRVLRGIAGAKRPCDVSILAASPP